MIDDLVALLSNRTGLTPSVIRRIAWAAPRRYKVYQIPKKAGGTRTIAHPAREVKLLQRAFLACVLNDLPVHSAATAYQKGKSLKDNVLPHAGDGPILKLDFRDFFPSIRAKDWTSYCDEKQIFATQSDIDLSASLLFRRGRGESVLRLSIGAPTSPALSNILLYDFDQMVWSAVSGRYVTYTRYADDMTFSALRTGFLQGVTSIVAKAVRNTQYPKLEINSQKTRLVTSKFHRDVTGLTLALDGRVTIGQLRKRNIRAGLYNAVHGQPSAIDLRILAGHIAFGESIEPGFIEALKEKHGSEVVDRVLLFSGGNESL